MSWTDTFQSLKSTEQRLAWMVALAADTIQIAGLPLFIEGAVSPADSVLDLVVGFTLIRLLGWHWAFLPTMAAELIPGMDLFPTWTAAVWYVTRQQRVNPGEPEILPPAYVFEAMRAMVMGNPPDWSHLALGSVLAIIYVVLAWLLFAGVFRHAIRTGLIARYSAETVS